MAKRNLHWRNLKIEPYRPFFFLCALSAVFQGAFWSLTLWRFYHGDANRWIFLNPFALHAHYMLFVFFAYFSFGFLLTAYPRWLDQPPLRKKTEFTILTFLLASEWTLFLGIYF